ncbi:MAG: hypothetical protein HQ591_10645 [candidate division Zixibacteria bacterium]|nr:hypothetical protein [Candidatus Tariuqbacter arcticus]
MKTAFNQFQQNIIRIKNLDVIYKNLETLTTSVIDLSDILRAELVIAVSAFDYFIHEIVRKGMIEIYKSNLSATPAYLKFNVTLEGIQIAVKNVNNVDWLDNQIRTYHSWRSFQNADNVADAIRLISIKTLWEEVGNYLSLNSSDVKKHLNLIVDRRNKIAHEADIDPTYPGSRWPITEGMVDEAIRFIESVAEAIYQIVK